MGRATTSPCMPLRPSTTTWITGWSIWSRPSTTGARSRRSSTSRPRCSASLPTSSTTPLTRSATVALSLARLLGPPALALVTVIRKETTVLEQAILEQALAVAPGRAPLPQDRELGQLAELVEPEEPAPELHLELDPGLGLRTLAWAAESSRLRETKGKE